MRFPTHLSHARIAERERQIGRIEAAARACGARASHLFGSVGRGDADWLSDVDAWVTFDDGQIEDVIGDRWRLYGEVGEVLIAHEMAPNRPVGGMYSLVLYQTAVGPMQVDWYLCPQRSSRVDGEMREIFAEVEVPLGERAFDGEAEQEESVDDSVAWLICMAFIAVKVNLRGRDEGFLGFLGRVYREIGETYRWDGLTVTEPISLPAIQAMLRQLLPIAGRERARVIESVYGWVELLASE